MTRKRIDPAGIGRKTSIYIDPATAEIIAARAGDGTSADTSTTIRILLGWYSEIVRRERPAFSDAEWNAIRDALNGTWLLAEGASVAMLAGGLPLELADACRLECLAEKWGVDGAELVGRVAALGFSARVAVIDDVIRFWARTEPAESCATSSPPDTTETL